MNVLLSYFYISWENGKQLLPTQPQGRLKTSEQFMSCHEMLCLFLPAGKRTVVTDACHAVESSKQNRSSEV